MEKRSNSKIIIAGLFVFLLCIGFLLASEVYAAESKYTVTFDCRGYGSDSSVTVEEGQSVTAVPKVKAKNNHYSIVGFSSDGGATTLTADEITKLAVTKDVKYTLVLKNNWKLNSQHVRYITPNKWGKFYPTKKLTKGEAAAMVYNLLQEKSGSKKYCKDVKASTTNGKAIGRLMYLGIISPNKSGKYYPNKAISKKELMAMIYKCKDKTNTYKSSSTVTKGEAVKMINSAIGRGKTDTATIKKGTKIRSFTDVTTGYKYYSAIMEASIKHVYKRTSSNSEKWTSYTRESQGIKGTGWKVIDGETYYISSTTKVITRNKTVQSHKLNSNGRYTTGSSKLDKLLKSIMLKKTTNSMSNSKKLKACYNYIYRTFRYNAGAGMKAVGTNSWDRSLAYTSLVKKSGNCYSFASSMTYLARKCGYNAKTISGYETWAGAGHIARHGWTEIKMNDGSKRICDTQTQNHHYTTGVSSNYFMRKYSGGSGMWHTYLYTSSKKAS